MTHQVHDLSVDKNHKNMIIFHAKCVFFNFLTYQSDSYSYEKFKRVSYEIVKRNLFCIVLINLYHIHEIKYLIDQISGTPNWYMIDIKSKKL